MRQRQRKKWQGLAAPGVGQLPLLIRACNAFVDNLTTMMRLALVIGAVFLVRDLHNAGDIAASATRAEPPVVQRNDDVEAETENDPTVAPVLTDAVQQALNCTFKAYRDAHYKDCVDEPSAVYAPPERAGDDTSHRIEASPLRLASERNAAASATS